MRGWSAVAAAATSSRFTTPAPGYFAPGSLAWRSTTAGYARIGKLVPLFDLIVADSEFNLDALSQWLTAPRPCLAVPPVVDANALHDQDFDRDRVERFRADGDTHFLFVGRSPATRGRTG